LKNFINFQKSFYYILILLEFNFRIKNITLAIQMNNLTKDRRIEELDVIPEHNSTIRNVDMY